MCSSVFPPLFLFLFCVSSGWACAVFCVRLSLLIVSLYMRATFCGCAVRYRLRKGAESQNKRHGPVEEMRKYRTIPMQR